MWLRLHHLHILPFMGIYRANDYTYLVSPFMVNGNLADYIRRYPDRERTSFVSTCYFNARYAHISSHDRYWKQQMPWPSSTPKASFILTSRLAIFWFQSPTMPYCATLALQNMPTQSQLPLQRAKGQFVGKVLRSSTGHPVLCIGHICFRDYYIRGKVEGQFST